MKNRVLVSLALPFLLASCEVIFGSAPEPLSTTAQVLSVDVDVQIAFEGPLCGDDGGPRTMPLPMFELCQQRDDNWGPFWDRIYPDGDCGHCGNWCSTPADLSQDPIRTTTDVRMDELTLLAQLSYRISREDDQEALVAPFTHEHHRPATFYVPPEDGGASSNELRPTLEVQAQLSSAQLYVIQMDGVIDNIDPELLQDHSDGVMRFFYYDDGVSVTETHTPAEPLQRDVVLTPSPFCSCAGFTPLTSVPLWAAALLVLLARRRATRSSVATR